MKAHRLLIPGISAVAAILFSGCTATAEKTVYYSAAHQTVYRTTRTTVSEPARVRLASIYRQADRYDEYIIRGDAAVSDSPDLANGIRLAAWDGESEDDSAALALASAVYFFEVPEDTVSVSIEVGYQNLDQIGNDQIAGSCLSAIRKSRTSMPPPATRKAVCQPTTLAFRAILICCRLMAVST